MDFEKDISACLEVLHAGGLILYPTDTVWGIGCDATNADAVDKIFALKRRNDEKSMIVLVTEERDLLRYTASPDPAIFDYLQNTSKPTTVIYPAALGVAANVIAGDGSIAIRICRESFCRHLIKRFRKPVVSTSANISGEPTPLSFEMIDEKIRKGVDYVVQYRQDDDSVVEPSAIIRWENGSVVTIRP